MGEVKEDVKQSMVIYKATNILNGKIYIGQTRREFRLRLNEYKSNSFNPNNKSYNLYICRAIRKYDWNNFKWEIIDTATTDNELNNKEIYWIKFYNSFGDGYNMTEGGEGACGCSHDDKMRLQISIAHGSKPFHLFDFDGNLVKTYISKIQCEREMGLYRACIVDALNDRIAYSGQYVLVYEEEYLAFGDELVRKKIERTKTSGRGSSMPQAVLNENIVREIKQMLMEDKYTHNDIADKYGITRGLVGAISRGRNWTHVEVEGFVPKLTRYSKLEEQDVIEIKQMLINGVHHKEISNIFEIAQPTISSIATGNTWSSIKVEGFTPIVRKGGELSPTAKLTKSIVVEIKKMLNQGEVALKIAEHFNINKSAVYDIKQGRTWREIEV